MVQYTVGRFLGKEGSKINQILLAVLINLPVLAYGTAVGWMSPMTLLLQSAESPGGAPLSDEVVSWMASTTFVAAMPAVFVFGYLADRIGRKAALLITSSQFALCWVIKLCSTADWALIFARVFVGSGVAGCYVVTPLYVKEISEDCIRGALGSLVILSQTVGNLLLYVLGDVMEYRAVLWTCLAIPVAHLVIFLVMPESPSYLLREGKLEETARVLGWLRCRSTEDPVIQNELQNLKNELEQESKCNKFALKTILTDKILFRAFRIVLTINVVREVCGAICVVMFASEIFKMASEDEPNALSLTPNQQTMMIGAVQLVGSLLASSVVERTGRKTQHSWHITGNIRDVSGSTHYSLADPLLMATSLVSGVGMCLLALWFLLRSLGHAMPSWLPVAALCVCIFCDASGLQPVPFVILTEMFSFQYRSTVTPITMATSCAFDFAQLRLFKPVASSIGVHVAFFIFSAICILNTVYIALCVPETKMRSLDDIYGDLRPKKERDALKKPDNQTWKSIDLVG